MRLSRKLLSPLNISTYDEKKPAIRKLFSPNNQPIILPYSSSLCSQPRVSYLKSNLRKPIIFDSLSLNSSYKTINNHDVTEAFINNPQTTKFNNQYNKFLKESKSLAVYPQLSREFTVEDQMKRKKHHRLQKTNNQFKSPVEYSPNYFKEGELIPGSSNIAREKSISLLKKSSFDSLNYKIKILDSKKIWINKIKNDLLLKDKQYVLNLKP